MARGVSDGFFVGGAGALSIVGADGDAVTITSDASQVIPLGSKRVNATGTTATGIVALYGGAREFTPVPEIGGFDDGFDDGFDT